MLPLGVPQTPKPSLTKLKHYEESLDVERILNGEEIEDTLASLNLFPEIPVDKHHYQQMDYFLPSKALDTIFTHKHGLTERDMADFQRVFPCPEESLKEALGKRQSKGKEEVTKSSEM